MYIFRIIKDLILKGKDTAIIKTSNLNAVVTTEVFKILQNKIKICFLTAWVNINTKSEMTKNVLTIFFNKP